MAYHHYSKEQLQEVFDTLSDLNEKGILEGIALFYKKKNSDSSQPDFIKVGTISEMSICQTLKKKIDKIFKKYSARTADDMAS